MPVALQDEGMPDWHYHRDKVKVLLKEALNFAFVVPSRPDFMCEEMQIDIARVNYLGQEDPAGWMYAPSFSRYPATLAKKYRWVGGYDEYFILASSIFATRFQNHDFRRWFLSCYQFS
jgi:hypothetical protein